MRHDGYQVFNELLLRSLLLAVYSLYRCSKSLEQTPPVLVETRTHVAQYLNLAITFVFSVAVYELLLPLRVILSGCRGGSSITNYNPLFL
jgi:hypothetical protein